MLWWTRPGLLVPEENLSYVMQSPTPAERYHLAISMIHVLPSLLGTNSASAIFYLSRLNSAPHMTPVYASDVPLPWRPQDSVPARPLRL